MNYKYLKILFIVFAAGIIGGLSFLLITYFSRVVVNITDSYLTANILGSGNFIISKIIVIVTFFILYKKFVTKNIKYWSLVFLTTISFISYTLVVQFMYLIWDFLPVESTFDLVIAILVDLIIGFVISILINLIIIKKYA